jgi:hypothetical protein
MQSFGSKTSICRQLAFVFVLIVTHCCCVYQAFAMKSNDTIPSSQARYSDYFVVGGGYSFGDATLNRIGLMYSVMYGHIFSPVIDAECSLHITGRDGLSNGFTQVLSSMAFDVSFLGKPFSETGFRIGAGISVRQRQFHYSAPSFTSTLGDAEDRYINDLSIGGHGKVDYVFLNFGNITIGSQLEGQFFIPVSGIYLFQNKPIPLQELQFPFPPMILSLGAFLLINF